MAPLGRSCSTIRLQVCARHCASARSTQPSGSSQSRGIEFHNTQLYPPADRCSTTEGFSRRSSRLPPPPNGRNQRCGWARSPIRSCVRAISCSRCVGIALQAERHRMRIGMVADPVAFAMRPRRQLAAFGIGQFFSDDEEGGLDAALAEDVQHVRCHLRLGSVIERQCQIEHVHSPSGRRLDAATR